MYLQMRCSGEQERLSPRGRTHVRKNFPRAIDDTCDLRVVMVATTFGTGVPCRSNAAASSLVRQVTANLLDALLDVGEKHGLLILDEAFEVSLGTLGEEKAFAGRYFEALVGELILVRVGNKAEIDLRS